MQRKLRSQDDIEPLGTVPTAFALSADNKNKTIAESIFHKTTHPQIKPFVRGLPSNRFPETPRSIAFRERFFPDATPAQWNDWHWQLRNRITSLSELGRLLCLSQDEYNAVSDQEMSLPVAITPYYASLLDEFDPAQALRRAVVPTTAEHRQLPGEAEDPLGEDHDSPVPGLVHRYPDRVLFLVTDYCSTYCRYCTRSRLVGKKCKPQPHMVQWEQALAYIAATPAVRDVLLSGGDPLTLPDAKLDYLLTRLRQIPHVEIVRIGTKVPMVLPQRITLPLVRMLKRHHPLFISIHATHPDELTLEAQTACTRLADVGIPLGSQTVLLSGINDEVTTMRRLMQGLLRVRVRPYYLYQCDPILGSGHFRTPVAKGLEIIRGLRGHTSGYAVPTYVIDAPGGGGKIPLLPEYALGHEGSDILLKNYADHIYRYPDAVICQGSEMHTHEPGLPC
jgi:lysine 2,3-aminomutase